MTDIKTRLLANLAGYSDMSNVIKTAGLIREAAATISALERRVEELEGDCRRKDELITAAVDDYNDALARIAELEGALKPFADESLYSDAHHEFVTVKRTLCDIARRALSKGTGE